MRKGELTESEFYTVVRATLAQEEIQHTTVANELAKREKDAEVTREAPGRAGETRSAGESPRR